MSDYQTIRLSDCQTARRVTCHMSRVTCHMSHVFFVFFCFFDKAVKSRKICIFPFLPHRVLKPRHMITNFLPTFFSSYFLWGFCNSISISIINQGHPTSPTPHTTNSIVQCLSNSVPAQAVMRRTLSPIHYLLPGHGRSQTAMDSGLD